MMRKTNNTTEKSECIWTLMVQSENENEGNFMGDKKADIPN
jgi:hypothetical protein